MLLGPETMFHVSMPAAEAISATVVHIRDGLEAIPGLAIIMVHSQRASDGLSACSQGLPVRP